MKTRGLKHLLMFSFLLILTQGLEAQTCIKITNKDMKPWPLTVDSGRVCCQVVGRLSSGLVLKAVYFEFKGEKYALNGTASSRKDKKGKPLYKDIKPIWRDDPQYPGTGVKIDIGPLIDKGLQLCE